MVLLGGLEFVVGGYLIHRYHRNKSDKRRLEDEANYRRQNTFPGATKPQGSYHANLQQPAPIPQQKYACYAPQLQPQALQRPHTAQPYPQNHSHPPQPYFNPQPVRRQDSWAGLSQMPIANGSQPQNVYSSPPLPPQPVHPSSLPPIPQQQPLWTQTVPQGHAPVTIPYYNTGFSASVPSFEPSSTAPLDHNPSTGPPVGSHTVDDNWETYGPQSPHVHFAVSDSPQPGEREDDPPPPYRP